MPSEQPGAAGAAEDPHAARLSDPAHRDQDGAAWHRGRFAERVRRQWNGVDVHGATADPAALDELAQAIQARVGGDVADVRARLDEFARMDAMAGPPAADPLVKPGEPA